MGLLIDSERLGQSLADVALERLPRIAYRLALDEEGQIARHATVDGEKVVETTEPQASLWRGFQAWLLKIAPEKQLLTACRPGVRGGKCHESHGAGISGRNVLFGRLRAGRNTIDWW